MKLLLSLLLLPGFLHGQITTVATTSTQAILQYTAPSGSACTVEVSESNTYSPLVHDVDTTLFAGSNLDSRTGSISNGTNRIFVAGKRSVETALDSSNYSRALQAYTTHYMRVTCGGTILTGTFATANIPVGNTFSDLPLTKIPTISSTDRSQRIIDPLTGALIKRYTLAGDSTRGGAATNGAYMTNAGYNRMCSQQLIGPGPGFLCGFPNGDGLAGILYYIIPTTGEVRYLGYLFPYSSPKVDQVDSKIYLTDSGTGQIIRLTYTGDFSNNTPNTQAPVSSEVFIPSTPAALVLAYDPTFPTFGGNGNLNVSGDYAAITFTKGVQDSYGSVAVLAMGNRLPIGSCGPDPLACPHIIAAAYSSQKPSCRWCGFHNVQLIPNEPIMNMELHDLNGVNNDGTGGVAGFGPYYSTLTANLAANATSLVIDGEPTNPGASDANWQNASAGDTFLLKDGSQTERITITVKVDATHWTIARTVPGNSYSSSTTKAVAECPGNWLAYWRFLDDPSQNDATNTYSVNTFNWPNGGHDDWGPNVRLTEGYNAVKGPILTNLAIVPNFNVTSSPTFAGVLGVAFGNSFTAHPSYHQILASATDQTWFLDQLPFIGDSGAYNPPGTLVTGDLWKTSMVVGSQWNRKVLPSFVVSATNQLTDISAPGSAITGGPGDAYKYCEARAIGECFAGSAVGDVYTNVPGGSGHCTPFHASPDICIGNHPVHGQSIVMLGLTNTTNDRYSRVMSNGLTTYRNMGGYATAKSLPDASWIMFSWRALDEIQNEIFIIKPPPYVIDTLDRSSFFSRSISITTPGSLGNTTASVEFGYAEYGTPSQHYCTSRQEACVATAASITNSNPFFYTSTDTYTRMSCATSCTIPLPQVPNHIIYYTVKFYDAGGAFVQNGTTGVITDPPAPAGTSANSSPWVILE